MKKSWKILIAVVSCALVLAMAAAVSLSVMTYLKVSAMENTSAEDKSEKNSDQSVEGEDNLTISGTYVIRSTKAISDAYLSGDSSALSEKDKETLTMASDILKEIITDGMSDYEKEQAVFLWMNKNIGHDKEVTVLIRGDVSTDNPHGVLSGRQAVCVGFATTFRLFMQMLGIPCMVVHDVTMTHTWDLVRIDGHWYHTDLYSAQSEKDPLQYMNRNDDLQSSLGSEWDRAFYPAADSLERCYVYQNAKECKDVYAIPADVRAAIDAQQPFLALLLPEDESVRMLAETLTTTLEDRLMWSQEYQSLSVSHATVLTEDGYFLYIKLLQYDYEDDIEDDPVITDEDRERIDKAITDSFGELTAVDRYDDYDDFIDITY